MSPLSINKRVSTMWDELFSISVRSGEAIGELVALMYSVQCSLS